MVRRALAVALLCLTLLFCGLDTSAVGHPAEGETALHALNLKHETAPAASALLAAAVFVAAAVAAWQVAAPTVGVVRRRSVDHVSPLATGWCAHALTRGPPARA